MLELLENAQASIDGLMNEAARGLIEQLLVLSAQELAGAKLRGRAEGDVLWHGTQRGQVTLAERKLRITHPRLRSKATSQEVAVPAYERLTGDARMATRVRDILVSGVSTRKYEQVLPEVAGTVGVSKSSVSRRMVEASAEQLRALNERSLKELKLLAIYIDGIVVDAQSRGGRHRRGRGRRQAPARAGRGIRQRGRSVAQTMHACWTEDNFAFDLFADPS
jgi:hypothetical protein